MPKTQLTKLRIDEVSLVDAPASPGAMVLLRKSATGHLPGVAEAIEALQEKHGAEAVDAFAVALADLSEPIAKAADAIDLQDLAPAILGLGEAIGDIFAKGDETDRSADIAEAQQSFLEIAESEIEKAMKNGGKATNSEFEACPGCKSPAACMKMSECAAKAVAKAALNQKPEDLAAVAEMGTAIAKAATSFADLNTSREVREKMNGMIWALQDSIQSIMSDTNVTDKAAMVRQSVAEFDAAVAALTDEAVTPENESMPQENKVAKSADALEAEVVALRAQVDAFEKQRRRDEAVAKANSLLPNGGPVAELADLIEKADENDMARITTIAKALTAQEASATMFGKAMGSSASPQNEEVHPLVKVAKAKAERAAGRSH